MEFFEMFSGIGGFRIGMEYHNFECVGYSEIDKYASKLYSEYFHDRRNYGDATQIKTEELPEFDILVGGFPCQAFSIAGRHRGFEDTRGTLFFEIARVVKDKKPKKILLENVQGLLSHDRGRTFGVILSTLDELGYNVEWQVLNSKDFGVPQNRKRVFIVGHLRGAGGRKIFPISRNADKTLEQIIGGIQGYRVYTTNGVASTQVSEAGGLGAKTGLYLITKPTSSRIRRLTPKECFRLQGFPDDIVELGYNLSISDTQLYRMAGNAVTVNVVECIAKKLS